MTASQKNGLSNLKEITMEAEKTRRLYRKELA
jgi:hypothetical protein